MNHVKNIRNDESRTDDQTVLVRDIENISPLYFNKLKKFT